MPHFEIQYSRNLDARTDIAALCRVITDELVDCGLFPLGGIRVRAIACDTFVVADGDRRNAYLDMVLRIGAGRSPQDKKTAGDAIFSAVCNHLGALFEDPHFALSFEVREIDPQLSWKRNSIHARLQQSPGK